MYRIAVQMNTHVAWEYDRELWNDVGERIRGNDNVSPKEEFAKVDENMKARIEREVWASKSDAKDAAKVARQAAAAASAAAVAAAKGGKGKGKGTKGQVPGAANYSCSVQPTRCRQGR